MNMPKIGDKLKIIYMEGEPHYNGKTRTVNHIDSIGQIHGTWGGLAIQPEHDRWEVIETK